MGAAMIAEIGRTIGAAVGIGQLAVTTQIDPAQDQVPALPIDETRPFDSHPEL